MRLTNHQKKNPNEVEKNELAKRAKREDYIRQNRIIDAIPGRNTAPDYRDNRNSTDVEYNSHHRIVQENKADLAFRERQARINFAISQPEYQRILARVMPEKKPWELLLSARKHVAHDKNAVVIINKALERTWQK